MSERRPHNLFVPLRVRFRSPAERAQWEREHTSMPTIPSTGDDPTLQSHILNMSSEAESPHTRQIKELIRLGNILRAELGLEEVLRIMRPEFSVSQSYFIPHEHFDDFADIPRSVDMSMENYEPGGWHPEDALIVPLFSPRKKKLLGFLSLDDPEDSKVPTLESIEVAELFANQAAIAIDNARIFQEKEAEVQVQDK